MYSLPRSLRNGYGDAVEKDFLRRGGAPCNTRRQSMVVMSSGQYWPGTGSGRVVLCSQVHVPITIYDTYLARIFNLFRSSTCSSPSPDCPYSSMVYISFLVLLSFSLFAAAADLYKILDSKGPSLIVCAH